MKERKLLGRGRGRARAAVCQGAGARMQGAVVLEVLDSMCQYEQ